jgi:hypothetical protein
MGSFTKRCVTQVTFMESTSVEDDIRAITLEVQSDGAGRLLMLTNGVQGAEIYLHHPDDLRILWETARQLWDQGDFLYVGDSQHDRAPPKWDDAAARVMRPLTTDSGTS